MASSKITTFKVKLKSATQKKRRQSDLVVMWHSMVDATIQILTTIHLQLLGVLESARLLIWHDEIQEIRHFLKNYLRTVPDDFSNSWRDGKLLCILLNKLQPGCIPDAETLDHNYALRNMYHAFDILERKFGITPTATVEQLVVCVEGSHLKLLEILSHLKKETENKLVPPIHVEEVETESEKQNACSDSKNCVSKGTGLMVAFVGRPANFVIFSSMMTDISLVIEIKGPSNTVCRERITKRSPKKKNSRILLEQNRSPFLRSNSITEKNNYQTEVDKADDCEKSFIPLEYDISLDKISVTYTPLVEGEHTISILWYGQHVSDSPYVVKVEAAIETRNIYSAKQFIPTFNQQDNSEDCANKERKNGTVTIQKPEDKIERIGRVIKRRVLRHIVKIKDKDIIVDSNGIEHLAAALLKMDYEIHTDTSKFRRNSWGFDGDAERKISAIRQFCIPAHELDAQNMKLHGRSRSLTINNNPRMPLRRSNSFVDEDVIRKLKLETVSEDSIHGHIFQENMDQDEEAFAYINEDFQTAEHLLDGNQVGLLIDNAEKTIKSLKTSSSTQENMLQSLPVEEEKEDSCNELNARTYPGLPQNNLTGSSKFSDRSAADKEIQYNSDIFEDIEKELKISAETQCNSYIFKDIEKKLKMNARSEIQCNSDNFEVIEKKLKMNARSETQCSSYIYKDIEKELKMNARSEIQCNSDIYKDIEKELKFNVGTFSDSHNNNIDLNPAVNKSGHYQDQNDDKTSSKTNYFDDKREIVKILNDLDEKNKYGNREESLTVFVEKFPNLDKCDVPFSEFKSQEKSGSKETLQFSSPTDSDSNKWRSPLYKSSKNVYSFRLEKHYQNGFEIRKCCKSCRKLKTLNRKLIARGKKINQNNSLHSEAKHSGSLCPDSAQSGDVLISEDIKIDFNPVVENKNTSPNSQQNNNQEFKSSKLKFSESPGKFSFEYYAHSSDDHITPTKCIQSSPNIELPRVPNVEANRIMDNTFVLSSKMGKFANSLKNSNHNNLYNNSTLRLNYDSSNDLSSSALEFGSPVIKFKEVSDTTKCQIKEHNLISLGQYNFNQFNPSTEKNKGSLVKSKIKKLERAVIRDSHKINSKYSSRSSISSDTVNVKDKLTFWENLCQKDMKMNQTEENITDDSNEEANHVQNECFIETTKLSEHEDTDVKVEDVACELSWPRNDTPNDLENDFNEYLSLHHANLEEMKSYSEHKHGFKMKRSFSDPILLDPFLRERLIFPQNSLDIINKLNHLSSTDNMSSSGDYLESSIDDGLYSSDPVVSTEDEYIDDEIPGNPLLTHWGDLNLMKSLKTANMSKHREYCQFIDTEILKNQFQSVEICPSECKVFGIGTYYGYVAIKNRFKVLTKGAGNGNLSASVQGFGKHDVSLVSVKYKHKDIYEVTYQVLRPGLYLISLRWMEKPIVGSPFLCKVTF